MRASRGLLGRPLAARPPTEPVERVLVRDVHLQCVVRYIVAAWCTMRCVVTHDSRAVSQARVGRTAARTSCCTQGGMGGDRKCIIVRIAQDRPPVALPPWKVLNGVCCACNPDCKCKCQWVRQVMDVDGIEWNSSAAGWRRKQERPTLAKFTKGECSQADYDSSAAGKRPTLAMVNQGVCSQAEYDSSAGKQNARNRQRRGAANLAQHLELARLGSNLTPDDVDVARRELFCRVLPVLLRNGRLFEIGITLAHRADGGSRLALHLQTGFHVRILLTTCACTHTCF